MTSGGRVTRPEVGSWIPDRIDSSVVLPAPLGPMMASRSPAPAWNETSRSASRSPNRLETPSAPRVAELTRES